VLRLALGLALLSQLDLQVELPVLLECQEVCKVLLRLAGVGVNLNANLLQLADVSLNLVERCLRLAHVNNIVARLCEEFIHLAANLVDALLVGLDLQLQLLVSNALTHGSQSLLQRLPVRVNLQIRSEEHT